MDDFDSACSSEAHYIQHQHQAMLAGADHVAEPPPVDISANRKVFNARVRAEMHNLVRALARRDPDEFIAGLRGAEGVWSTGDLDAMVAPCLEELGEVRFDHAARLSHRTVLQPVGPHQWVVRQSLLGVNDDEEEGGSWEIEARIDLRADTNPEGPIVELVSIRG